MSSISVYHQYFFFLTSPFPIFCSQPAARASRESMRSITASFCLFSNYLYTSCTNKVLECISIDLLLKPLPSLMILKKKKGIVDRPLKFFEENFNSSDILFDVQLRAALIGPLLLRKCCVVYRMLQKSRSLMI